MDLLQKIRQRYSYGQTTYAFVFAIILLLFFSRLNQLFDWKIIHDSAIFLFSSIQMEYFNAIPYLDIHEENPPMTYLIYYGIGKLFGFSHEGYRIFDAIFLFCQMGLIYCISRSINRKYAVLPPFVFAVIYLFLSPTQSLQREYLVLFTLGVGFLQVISKRRDFLSLFIIGVCVGIFSWVKVEFSLYGVALFFLYVYYHGISLRREFSKVCALALYSLLGFMIPTTACLTYLYANGALDAFMTIALDYWPLYRKIGSIEQFLMPSNIKFFYFLDRIFWLGFEAGYAIFLPSVILFGSMLIFSKSSQNTSESSRKLKALFVLIIYSVFVPLIPMKLFLHHYFPFAYFASIGLTLYIFENGNSKDRKLKVFITVVTICCYFTYLFKVWSSDFYYRQDRVKASDFIVEFFKKRGVTPGERIQPFGWTDNGVVIPLIEMKAKLPSRFIYAYQFFHHSDTDYIKELRREFMEAMRNDPPKFILEAPFLTYRLIGSAKDFNSVNFFEYDKFRDENYRFIQFSKNYWGTLMLYERKD